uniref:CAP-Gly domain-containing protein n=1 Tax=Acrobeloides nanus TaxID=290746 RepID=A0A914C1M2_9BILA
MKRSVADSIGKSDTENFRSASIKNGDANEMSVHLTIISNITEFPYEKSFPNSITLKEFKKRLVLIIGIDTADIYIELRDKENQFIKKLTDDNATLEDLDIKQGQTIYVESKNGAQTVVSNDDMTNRYVMDDHKYEQLNDSLRAFKKKFVSSTNNQDASNLQLGQKCIIRLPGVSERVGTISFIGETHFKPGIWVGITYEEPFGKNDGSFEGKRYFTASPNYGSFVRPNNVYTIEEPNNTNEMEEI